MNQANIIIKLFKGQNLYFKGLFRKSELRNNTIEYPTIFEAKGRAIKSGNWNSCTSINTAEYIFNNYIKTTKDNVAFDKLSNIESKELAELIYKLSWDRNNSNPNYNKLKKNIDRANELLLKMEIK
jgi:hypothetical protein